MRIIYDRNTESDYYDCMQKYTEDRETTYKRKELQEETLPFKKVFEDTTYSVGLGLLSPKYSIYHTRTFIIGFCGELILSLEKELVMPECGKDRIKEYYYGYENIMSQIELAHASPTKYQSRHLKKWELKTPTAYYENVKTVLDKLNKKAVEELFEITPIWSLYRGYCHDEVIFKTDPLLKRYNFQTVYSPPNAYQKLESYLYNVARPLKPIPEISDEIMAEAKGFNKYSFRKDKSK